MPISLDQTHASPIKADAPANYAAPKWLVLLFWGVVALLLALAVGMRLYHLALPFDRDNYDEGVYWQSLRAMQAGQGLYKSIFYSQPPLFLLSTYPGFALFGGSLWSARFGIMLVSLLGFPGAYLLGKALIGRLGAVAALLLLLADPIYLYQSQTIQAEASSVALTLLAVAFAFLWWKEPDGRRGLCWAALCGLTAALSILCKLLSVATLVPIGLLMLARMWQIWRHAPGTSRQSWLSLLIGVGTMLVTLALLVLPFAGSFQAFWSSVVTFHQVAAKVAAQPALQNYKMLRSGLLSTLMLAAIYGSLTALLRRDWRVLALLAWFLTTVVLLYQQQPLFKHHLVALGPPLIALALLGLADPSSYKDVLTRYTTIKSTFAPIITIVAILLLLATMVGNFQQEIVYYQTNDATAASSGTQLNIRVANDLRQALTPDQWLVTDGQFVAGLADRSTPPSLVDTSGVRITTGYVTIAQLEQATLDPRVHAVLFYTGRLYHMYHGADFRAWVSTHFHLLHAYSHSQELWVR